MKISTVFAALPQLISTVFAARTVEPPKALGAKPCHYNTTGVKAHHNGQDPPHFVLYHNRWQSANNGFPTAAELKGWNVLNAAFYLANLGPWDNALQWTTLPTGTRERIKSDYAAAGVKLLVSAFGSTDAPTSWGLEPRALAKKVADFVTDWDFEGVDVNYEDLNAFELGTAENWIATFTEELRSYLPAPQYIITYAPLAPWFMKGRWPGGGWLKVHETVGDLIDWYNIQFYNQEASRYDTCETLLHESDGWFTGTSVFEIADSGVPLNKLVIGKPGAPEDATNTGYMHPADLGVCVTQAANEGWDGGIMAWQWWTADAAWIAAARGSAWPVPPAEGSGRFRMQTGRHV
ncbi:glycoside hydrolase [Auricularia subglabra TFB-10046 SS5]|nr:glycoside hydrolase [Auricularia subglabra TFB-10046 SS5]